MSLFQRVWDWAEEGYKHDIPTCCGLRFGFDCERPKVLPRLGPMGRRVQHLLVSPRHAFAFWDQQGYVPCEYHLIRWLLTGIRPEVRQDSENVS